MKHWAFFLSIFYLATLTNTASAYKSEDDTPTHQHIALEAFNIWPKGKDGEAYQEMVEYLDKGNWIIEEDGSLYCIFGEWDNKCGLNKDMPPQDYHAKDYPRSFKTGKSIVEGSQEEDFYDLLLEKYGPNMPNGFKTNDYGQNLLEDINPNYNLFVYGGHMWDNDLEKDAGLWGFDISAPMKAEWYFYGGTVSYHEMELVDDFLTLDPIYWLVWEAWIEKSTLKSSKPLDGIINAYKNGDKNRAYYLLGRVVHLLSDMTVPAHVLWDPHLDPNDDAYETLLGSSSVYNEYGFNSSNCQPDGCGFTPSFNWNYTVGDLGYNNYTLASAPWENGNTHFEGTKEEWDDFGTLYHLFWRTSEVADNFDSDDIDGEVDQGNFNYTVGPLLHNTSLSDVKRVADSSMPMAMLAVAELYKLFWDLTHPVEVTINNNKIDNDSISNVVLGETLNINIIGKPGIDLTEIKLVINDIHYADEVTAGPFDPDETPTLSYQLVTDGLVEGYYQVDIYSTNIFASLPLFSFDIFLQTDIEGPSVEVVTPAENPLTTTSDNLNIAGTASDSNSINLVTWSNDRGGSGNCTGTESWNANGITLKDGINVITVVAYDENGNSTAKEIFVNYQNLCTEHDLVVTEVKFYNSNIEPNQSTDISATIQNTGLVNEQNADVTVTVTGENYGQCSQNKLVNISTTDYPRVTFQDWPSGSGWPSSCSPLASDQYYTASISVISQEACDKTPINNIGNAGVYVSESGTNPPVAAFAFKKYSLISNIGPNSTPDDYVTVGNKTFTLLDDGISDDGCRLSISGEGTAWYSDTYSEQTSDNQIFWWISGVSKQHPSSGLSGYCILVIGEADNSKAFETYYTTVPESVTALYSSSISYDDSLVYSATGDPVKGFKVNFERDPAGSVSTSDTTVSVDTHGVSTGEYGFAILSDDPKSSSTEYIAFGEFKIIESYHKLSIDSGPYAAQVEITINDSKYTYDLPITISYKSGSNIHIKAISNDSTLSFENWSGDLGNSTSNPLSFNLSSETSITANFVRYFTLNISAIGDGLGEILVNDVSITLPFSASYSSNTTVKVESQASPGSAFIEWEGNLTGITSPNYIVMTGNKDISAKFLKLNDLNIVVNPTSAGSIMANGTEYFDGESPSFHSGDKIYLSASPQNGFVFNTWSGCDTFLDRECFIEMNSNKTIEALFANCEYSVTPESLNIQVPATESSGSIEIITDKSCPWKAYENANWIEISGEFSGKGNGTINYTILENTSENSREADIHVADKTFRITQTAPILCTYSITPTSDLVNSSSGSGSISVTTQPGCSWEASESIDWLNFTSGNSGTGNGATQYSYLENTGTTERTATFTVADHTFTITQNPPVINCIYSINPQSTNVSSAGGTAIVNIDTNSSKCTWNVVDNLSWASTSKQNGSGNASITVTVDENISLSSRTGNLTIAGKNFSISQKGTECTYSLAPTGKSHSFNSESGSFSVITPQGCSWKSSENYNWINITSGFTGSGNGTVKYSIDSNKGNDTLSRKGSISVANKFFSITQQGTKIVLLPALPLLLRPDEVKDADGDGYDSIGFGGTDCNDNDRNINPGQIEVCDDNIDNNCSGQIDEGCSECTSTTLQNCNTQSDCEDAEGYWYNDTCNAPPQSLLFDPFEGSSYGTINGATYTNIGYNGQALLFDEVGDSVRYDSSFFPSEGTFEAYVYLNGDNPNWNDIIFDSNARGGYIGKTNIALYIMSDRTLSFRFWGPTTDSSDKYYISSSVALELNTWYSVGASWGSQGIYLYIDGQLQGSDPSATDSWDPEPVYLGDCPDDDWAGSNYYNSLYGIIDSVRTSTKQNDITY